MKWYHNWQQAAMKRFDENYYPGHDRMPNFIVRGLYGVGHFIGDFFPMVLNLINGVYNTFKRFLEFIVGLLIEASTVVVLIGTIAFSISHSVELLRRAGATGGMEYVGVLMFEIVFISSTATLTGMLMRNPKAYKTIGFWFSSAGFTVGIVFVLWSNISALASSWEGTSIGILTPVLLIIAEGIIAVRNWETGKITGHIPRNLVQWMRENQVSYEEIMLAVEAFRKERPDMDGLPADLDRMMKKHHVSTNMLKQQVQGYRTEQTEGSDTQNGSREEKLEKSNLENLETSHPVSSHLKAGGSENSPAEEETKLENRETGDLEENLETPKLEEMNLEDQETGDLETSDRKPEESITNWKLEIHQPKVEKPRKPVSLKASTLDGDKLEDGKREAGELEKPETGDPKNLETSELEESATGEMETSSSEDLEVETGERIGELEEKLETSNLENGESSRVENLEKEKLETSMEKPETGELEGEKQETSKVENQEEEKFTKEDLKYFSREELEAMMGADPEDVAVQILERQGKLPGRDRLIRLTGCKEWPARKAISKLKKPNAS